MRVDVRIHFTNHREIEYMLPINLLERHIDHFTVTYPDGTCERFKRVKRIDYDSEVIE